MFFVDVETMAEEQVLIFASSYHLSIIGFHQEEFFHLLRLHLTLFHRDSLGGVLFARIHQGEFLAFLLLLLHLALFIRIHQDEFFSSGLIFSKQLYPKEVFL